MKTSLWALPRRGTGEDVPRCKIGYNELSLDATREGLRIRLCEVRALVAVHDFRLAAEQVGASIGGVETLAQVRFG